MMLSFQATEVYHDTQTHPYQKKASEFLSGHYRELLLSDYAGDAASYDARFLAAAVHDRLSGCVIHFTLRKQGRRTPQHINCNHNPFLLLEHRKNSEISFSLVIPFSMGEKLPEKISHGMISSERSILLC